MQEKTPAGAITLFEFERLSSAEGVVAACSERRGGVSEPPYETLNLGLHVGDDPRAVAENRKRFASALGLDVGSFVVAQQVHGDHVQEVTASDRGRGIYDHADAFPATDALITRAAGVALAVTVADCVPVFLYDRATPAVGLVHAGWSGTVAHVAVKALQAMTANFGTDPRDVTAALGPSIGPSSYEVGAEVADKAVREFGDGVVRRIGGDKALLDLWGANVADLEAAGVERTGIEVAGIDTFNATDRFFSDRRQRPTGRCMAVVVLQP